MHSGTVGIRDSVLSMVEMGYDGQMIRTGTVAVDTVIDDNRLNCRRATSRCRAVLTRARDCAMRASAVPVWKQVSGENSITEEGRVHWINVRLGELVG